MQRRAAAVRCRSWHAPPAVASTHMHSDHVEGFIDIMQLRLHNVGAKLDVVCSADAVSPLGHTVSCKKFAAHIGDTLFHAGEIAQRVTEDKRRPSGGPAELTNVTSPSSLERTLNRFGHWAKCGCRQFVLPTCPAMPPIAWIHPLAVWSSAVTPEMINPRLRATTQPLINVRN